jgi:5-methylthioribose kinase
VTAPEPELARFLRDAGLAAPGEEGIWQPLAGGVSSDIWRVTTSRGDVCVKRALAKLKVTADWEAPVERNASEWAYMQVVQGIAPGTVPTPIAQDEEQGLFAMAWLAPDQHVLWKTELLAGRVHPEAARDVGDLVGRIHAETAGDQNLRDRFATDANFHALRIDPYLLETARCHPDLSPHSELIARRVAETKLALVHGDVSPKNILIGSTGPVLLDAEVAWFGDPAFDLAFCLTHLMMKARVVAGARDALIMAFDAFAAAYLARVDWEDRASLEGRAAALLPALILARVDGKSPLEYLDELQRTAVRTVAREALARAPDTLAQARRLFRADA